MQGRIIDIGTGFRPNPDGTEEGIIAIKSESNANCFDTLVWKTEPKASRAEVIDEIIKHLEAIKKDIDLGIQMQQMKKEQVTADMKGYLGTALNKKVTEVFTPKDTENNKLKNIKEL